MRTLSITAALVVLFGCSKQADTTKQEGSTFTLSTGVSVASMSDCTSFEGGQKVSLQKTGSGYLVSAVTPLRCEGKLAEPYLTAGSEHRATLVLPQSHSNSLFSSGCECPRSIKIAIQGRLEPGDTLYVLNDADVLGHFTVP